MEYFLGAIHWLDALSPPLEKHLHKLAETVQAMLKVDADGRNVKQASAARPPSRNARRTNWLLPAICCAALVMLIGGGGWLYRAGVLAPGPAPGPTATPPAQAVSTAPRTQINSVESCGLTGAAGAASIFPACSPASWLADKAVLTFN
jgi:hypothetical protein